MRAIVIAVIVFVGTFGAAIGGLWLRPRIPAHHLQDESKDTVKLVVGLIATMSAIVLGLLIASAKTYYDTQNAELQMLSVNLVELDRVLARYGPEAADARTALHRDLAANINRLWPKDAGPLFRPRPPRQPYKFGPVYDDVENLQPKTAAQQRLQARAAELTGNAAQARLLMLEQAANPIAWPFLTTLVCWGAFLFFGFGLLTRRNATVVAALLVGALSLASAAFLILELSGPIYGMFRLSPEPLLADPAEMQG